ncbi:1,4-beta-D-glucan cellobiohydrolase [Ceratobasidium theobromae]|uniref:Glucanase n=1 Tax=Ceratobasidium theobromae TaxID=1582974 RepID=A0A5N5QGA5_9AGAM|nr:1,4-beta-D-glucan cellobiohydrolase [Ceratobasidium theobromae]
MAPSTAALFSITLSLLASVCGQQAGTVSAETHPSLSWQKCTKSGGCATQSQAKIVLDSNWRWVHTTSGYTNCYTGNAWDTSICPDPTTCASNCALDGADYSGTYGITTSGNELSLKFVTGSNVGSRVYLLKDDSTYEMFKLKNQEFTFDVDVSQLPCGLNGALYFSEMDADGGMAKHTGNKAGAKYGTGYCDAQCPRDIKFINGEANVNNWTGSSSDPNSGTGQYGTCCSEMDVWEANSISTAYTPHPCTVDGQTRCEGSDCQSGYCDPAGCDFNSFRMGNASFYGKIVDPSQKMTIVTQFITADGTANGELSEIRRIYVQNGQVIQNSKTQISGMDSFDSITPGFCTAQKTAFGDSDLFTAKGGFSRMGEAFDNGMVLVMSIWDDHAANMLWLDSNYPVGADATKPGVARGTCATSSGVPSDVESSAKDSVVKFSNIKFGDLDSTYSA